jgi:DNA-binding response OmpR family regulator
MATVASADEQQIHSSQRAQQLLRVLVVEDDPDCAACLALFLRFNGVAAEVATNGSAALQSIQVTPPDVVLLDLSLPDMDGYQLARRLRRLSPTMLLLIALTGNVPEKDSAGPSDRRFAYHFVKPVDPFELVACLHNYAKSL